MQCSTTHNAKMRITNVVLDSDPILKTQLNLNMNVLLCFVVLLSYSVLHLEFGRAVLQLDVPQVALCIQVAIFYKDLCATVKFHKLGNINVISILYK